MFARLGIFVFGLFSFQVFGYENFLNQVDYNQNPPSIEWKQIDTEHFQLIFPSEITQEAQRSAHLLEKSYPFVMRSLEVRPKKIPVVLQNQTVNSNGLVTLAPWRSEWFMSPATDRELSNLEWIKGLAVHELRHVAQFEKSRQHFGKVYEFLAGDLGTFIGLAFSHPVWLLEGDATVTETALTEGGRGRIPAFERDLRALLLSGLDFSADKAILRSYKDWVPNQYVYGYFLTASLRRKYGDLFLSRLTDQSTRTSWNPLSFYNSADRMLEEDFEAFYRDTMKELTTNWRAQLEKLTPTPYEVKTLPHEAGWTNHHHPMVTSDGGLVTLKSGLSFIDHFVLTKDGKEEVLFYPGYITNEFPMKLRKDRFAYTELVLDPRWGPKDHSRIMIYDVNHRRHTEILVEGKWRLPVLGPSGTQLMAVGWETDQSQNVSVFSEKGELLKTLNVDPETVIVSLDWINEDEIVMVLRDRNDKKSLVKVNLISGSKTTLLPPSYTNLGFVTVNEGKIIYESPQSGIDNLFLLEEGKSIQLTSSKFGAYAPVLHGEELYYNDYSAEGMKVVKKIVPWKNESKSEGSFFPYYDKIAQFEGPESFSKGLKEESKFEVKDYSQVKHALNGHSWLFSAPALDNNLGLIVFSRDVLNKLTVSGGAVYNLNEKGLMGVASMAWQYYYPVIDLTASYGHRRDKVRINAREVEDSWDEGVVDLGVSLPWRKISGRFNQAFSTRAFAKMIHASQRKTLDQSELDGADLFSPGVDASYSILQRRALRDIFPNWGLVLLGSFQEGRDIKTSPQRGSLLSADSRAFLPGLALHHSFYHEFAYEKQRDDFYQYASRIYYPRGASYTFLEEFTKYSGNYTMPLVYLDENLGEIINFKRLSLNGFYDTLNGRIRGASYNLASAGWELMADINLFRFPVDIMLGLRRSYILTGPDKDNSEIFIQTPLAGF